MASQIEGASSGTPQAGASGANTVIPITEEVHNVATHPKDDLILATAISARADYLVTGDTKLQGLEMYHGVSILSPRRFLETLTQEISED